jgi:hypothetical protein
MRHLSWHVEPSRGHGALLKSSRERWHPQYMVLDGVSSSQFWDADAAPDAAMPKRRNSSEAGCVVPR